MNDTTGLPNAPDRRILRGQSVCNVECSEPCATRPIPARRTADDVDASRFTQTEILDLINKYAWSVRAYGGQGAEVRAAYKAIGDALTALGVL